MSYFVPHFCGIYYLPQSNTRPAQPSWLPQVSLSGLSKLHDTASSTTLTQTFINPSQTTIAKAKYAFPLYESSAVVSFRCYIGKRVIEGVVKERDQAKVEYKEAVERGETAGLLEQHTPDVFSTSLGKIPAGETVKIEIEYLIELKHDAEVDGLRFTIPMSIAPRYGDAPSGVSGYNNLIPGAIDQGGIKISVQVAMPSNIRSVQSPSHNIAMHLGGHVEDIPDNAFNPKHALATLSQTSTALGKDFILLVKCTDLAFPRALLETHPTIPNSKALMVSLVPKFTLPPGTKPEIVFVVDRSGSMSRRMGALKSSLGVFLKSLPVGVKFNICSFGFNHSFLWNKSKSYSAESLEEANRHVQSMQANFGGTEILPPIKSTISRRYMDLPLEIMVLTDGEVWRPETLFEYVEQATAKGDVRLFSLGIGQDVSHALVEGMARVGRGFAQIVSDETDGFEGKVVRMLRGGLSAHVNDYRLEWEGKPGEVDTKKSGSSSVIGTAVDKPKKKISLFDTNTDSEAPISFSGLAEFVVPSVLQAPYKLPPLFPFSRYTAYIILSGDVPPPSYLCIHGTTPSEDELTLEIPVQGVLEKGEAIHKLAARKILQELEEGTGYIHSGKYGVDKELNPGTFDEWVQREGVRVGLKYGLASKWTSFVAIQKREVVPKEQKNSALDTESVTELGADEFEVITDDVQEYEGGEEYEVVPKVDTHQQKGKKTSGFFANSSASGLFTPPLSQTLFGSSGGGLFGSSSSSGSFVTPPSQTLFGGSGGGLFGSSSTSGSFATPPSQTEGLFRPKGGSMMGDGLPQSSTPTFTTFAASYSSPGGAFHPQMGSTMLSASPPMPEPTTPTVQHLNAGTFGTVGFGATSGAFGTSLGGFGATTSGTFGAAPTFGTASAFGTSPGAIGATTSGTLGAAPTFGTASAFGAALGTFGATPTFGNASGAFGATTHALAPRERTIGLITLQTFEGSFRLTPTLATLLGTTLTDLQAKLTEFVPTLTGLSEEQRKSLWATVLAVGMFERKLAAEKDVWELVVEKARAWMAELVGVGYNDVERSGELVGEALGGSNA